MGISCLFHRTLALQPQDVEHQQWTYWHAWTLLPSVPRLSKLHRLTTREERGTQDRESRVHKDLQEGAARPMKGPNTCGMQYRWPFHARGACCRPQAPEVKKMAGTELYFPGVYTPRRVDSQILILQFLHFVHAPTLKEPKSCRSIFLACVIFKIVERLIYVRVEPIIDSLLPQEQAGFRHGRANINQVTLLTQDIKDSFSAKKQSGAVFVDLTTAFDCMASWSHLQATAIGTWLPQDSHDHGTGWQSQFHPYHQQRQTDHVTRPQKVSRDDTSLHPFL